jgi:hypothetical protein
MVVVIDSFRIAFDIDYMVNICKKYMNNKDLQDIQYRETTVWFNFKYCNVWYRHVGTTRQEIRRRIRIRRKYIKLKEGFK